MPYLALRFPIHKWAAAAGLLAGIGYLLFSGGSVPTQRAMIMLGLVLVALLPNRVEVSARGLGGACWRRHRMRSSRPASSSRSPP